MALRITFVKKILMSGEPCAKCADVEARLVKSGLMQRIDRVVVADERIADSEGMRIARRHGVTLAPFFVVENDDKTTIYTVYLRFVRETFGSEDTSELEEARDILRANPDLDLI